VDITVNPRLALIPYYGYAQGNRPSAPSTRRNGRHLAFLELNVKF
jgi:hypothetical protein